MSENEPLKPFKIPELFKNNQLQNVNNTTEPDWKFKSCKDCLFYTDVPGYKKTDLREPTVKECRRVPPMLFPMPGLDNLRRPIMQIVSQYPRLQENFPACAEFKNSVV